jgi:hypothetical protein
MNCRLSMVSVRKYCIALTNDAARRIRRRRWIGMLTSQAPKRIDIAQPPKPKRKAGIIGPARKGKEVA